MPSDDAVDRHFWLIEGMARSAGVRLADHIGRGTLSHEKVAAMIADCATCQCPDACIRWLAEGPHDGEAPPSWCLNHETIERLIAVRRG